MSVGCLCAGTMKTLRLCRRTQGVPGTLDSHCGRFHMIRAPWLPGEGHSWGIWAYTEDRTDPSDPLCGPYGSGQIIYPLGLMPRHWSPWRRGTQLSLCHRQEQTFPLKKKKNDLPCPTWLCHLRHAHHPGALKRAPWPYPPHSSKCSLKADTPLIHIDSPKIKATTVKKKQKQKQKQKT